MIKKVKYIYQCAKQVENTGKTQEHRQEGGGRGREERKRRKREKSTLYKRKEKITMIKIIMMFILAGRPGGEEVRIKYAHRQEGGEEQVVDRQGELNLRDGIFAETGCGRAGWGEESGAGLGAFFSNLPLTLKVAQRVYKLRQHERLLSGVRAVLERADKVSQYDVLTLHRLFVRRCRS